MVMLTGSSEPSTSACLRGLCLCASLTIAEHTAHDSTIPFVPPLIDFVRRIGTSRDTSHIKLIGVCFGHQAIALAMGGKSEKGTNGWEAGVYRNDFVGDGRYWWTGDVPGEGGKDCVVSAPSDQSPGDATCFRTDV